MIFGLALGTGGVLLALWVVAFFFPREVLTVDSGAAQGDVLVVLGGGDGRAARAAELYRQGAAPRVLVTGYGDCAVNVLFLENHGVPGEVITSEPTAFSTMENAQHSVPLLRAMGAHRIILVTSWYHSRRALACFRHVAPDLIFISRPSYLYYEPRNWHNLHLADRQNIEYLKIPFYFVVHGVWPF